VLNRCGFDVLAKPFVNDEVSRVVAHALCNWSEVVPKRPTARANARLIPVRAGRAATM
jgi:hypothetical protein